MYRILVACVPLLLICVGALPSAASQKPADQPFYDARALHDIATMQFDKAAGANGLPWLVIQIMPGHSSGAMTVPGAFEQEGHIVVPPDRKPALIIRKGSWRLLDGFPGDKAQFSKTGTYDWMDPWTISDRRKTESSDIWDVFVKGGVLLCQRNPEVKDGGQFDHMCLIPEGWEVMVRPAWDGFEKNIDIFTGEIKGSEVAGVRGRLVELLKGSNPILSVLAFRRLIDIKQVDGQLLDQTLSGSDGIRQACLMYIALMSEQELPIKEKDFFEKMSAIITTAKKTEELKPVALAAYAVASFNEDRSVGAMCRAVIEETHKRYQSLIAGAAPDPYLDRIFKVMGIGSAAKQP